MDSHFEVILERIKQLTEKTGTVVWFEIPENATETPVLVLISETDKIGMIKVDYSEKIPVLNCYKLTKPIYDKLLVSGFTYEGLSKFNKKTFDTAMFIKWVVGAK